MTNTIKADQTCLPVFTDVNELFAAAMALNQRRFDDGSFDDAYHALHAALHLAEVVGSEEGPLVVERIANEQWAWINQHALEYRHSSTSTAQRGNRAGSTWEGLALMAHMRARALAAKHLPPMSKVDER